MTIKIFNTLTNKKETFKPVKEGLMGMYNCGPTVYNYAHIGNLRAYVLADTIRRAFEYAGYEVKQVINITDVGHIVADLDTGDDKIEKAARLARKTATEISTFYTEAFFRDLEALNIKTAGTIFPKATDHIPEQISLIEQLKKKGYTYKTSDGIYYDTSKFPDYGKLGNINIKGLKEGARVETNQEKKNATDFALWKFSKPQEKRQQEWPSPWGIGFPGWHIECSAMSMKYLGQTFDIHTGGIDHIPVHHNNEIAQSEAATGKQYVDYWLHNAFINVAGGKMAKSEDNFIRLETLTDKNIDPLAYRYWLLGAHYRTPMLFSFEALEGAQNAYVRLKNAIDILPVGGSISELYKKQYEEKIKDDLDTPGVLALIWQILKDESVNSADKKATILDIDKLLGLRLDMIGVADVIPDEINSMAQDREEARKNKDWAKADEIRKSIEEKGYVLNDTEKGYSIKKK